MSPGLISVWMVATPSLDRGVGCGILLSDRPLEGGGGGKAKPVDG